MSDKTYEIEIIERGQPADLKQTFSGGAATAAAFLRAAADEIDPKPKLVMRGGADAGQFQEFADNVKKAAAAAARTGRAR